MSQFYRAKVQEQQGWRLQGGPVSCPFRLLKAPYPLAHGPSSLFRAATQCLTVSLPLTRTL